MITLRHFRECGTPCISIAALLLVMGLQLHGADSTKPVDADLAAIGSDDKGIHKEQLITPGPPQLPETVLPWTLGSQPFTPMDKLDTPQELTAELDRIRTRYEPFTANLAPAIPNTRITAPITSFDWRQATPEDGKDFLIPLTGKGDW